MVMSTSVPGNPVADRNLLFGILAVQMDFISRDALIAATNAWVLNKAKALGEVLVHQGALTASRRAMLESLVDEHVRLHDNNPQKSLASLSPVGSTRQGLAYVGDQEVQASLASVGVARSIDPDPF